LAPGKARVTVRRGGKGILDLQGLRARNEILAGFQQQNFVLRPFAKPAGDDATGGPTANDDVIEFLILELSHCRPREKDNAIATQSDVLDLLWVNASPKPGGMQF